MHRSDRRRCWLGPAVAAVLLVAVGVGGCGDQTAPPGTPRDPAPGTIPEVIPPGDSTPADSAPADSAGGGSVEGGQTVSPDGAVAIAPGQSIQEFVSRYPEGTKFLLKAGTHSGQTVRPRDGQQFLGEWPNTVLDGGNSAQYAFETLRAGARDVLIQGLIIQHYATGNIAEGAIQGDNGKSWTIQGNEVRRNAAVGIRIGDGFKVLRNNIHHNGINGIAGYKADDVLIEGNEVAHNNTSNTRLAPVLSTIAGIKVLMGHNFTARGNYVHHNKGKGIWTDHMLLNTLIEGNRVTDNTGPGIWHEASYGAVIRNNYAGNNGLSGASWLEGAGIQVSNSPDVEIYGNTVEYNTNGITAMYARSYPASGPHGPRLVRNLSVHDNVVRMRKGRVGIVTNTGSDAIFTSWNNRWENNTYYIGSLAAPFAWRNQNYTVRQWQAVPQDASGTFRR